MIMRKILKERKLHIKKKEYVKELRKPRKIHQKYFKKINREKHYGMRKKRKKYFYL